MFPLTFHLLQKCQKYCKRSKLNVKMPQLLRRPRSEQKKFLIIALTESSFCPVLMWSQKKRSSIWVPQVFYVLSATYKSVALWTAAVYSVLGETNTPVFGRRKNAGICKNSVPKCWKKFCTFLHLSGTLAISFLIFSEFPQAHQAIKNLKEITHVLH